MSEALKADVPVGVKRKPFIKRAFRKTRDLLFRPFRTPRPVFAIVGLGRIGGPTFQHIKDLCAANNIGYFPGGESGARLNFLRSEQGRLLDLLSREFDRSEKVFAQTAGGRKLSIQSFKDRLGKENISHFDLLIVERQKGSTIAASKVTICFWWLENNYSGSELYVPGVPHQHISRVRPRTIKALLDSHADTAGEGRDIHLANFPIDVVYTWVNDKDPAWAARKARHSSTANPSGRGDLAERFRNRDELRYSLRSLEMFAPFVRKIFIVTDNQIPEWLNTLHPKIEMVSHTDIYRDGSVLPTFNSSGIETQIHHIEGLAEHFLYFNDDFFLGQLAEPENFFGANGVPYFFASDQRVYEPDIDDSREAYVIADRNAVDLMRRDFGAYGRPLMLHAPYPCRRSYLYTLEERYQAEFDRCAANRFRDKSDLRPIAFMHPNFGFLDGKTMPGQISHRYMALWKPLIKEQLNNVLRTRRYKSFCINDAGLPDSRAEDVGAAVREFLEAYFPFKSSFEK